MMNWKLITVVLVSFILLIACYLSLYQTNFVIGGKSSEKELVHNFDTVKKIKINFQNEEDFKKFHIPDGHTGYYFPTTCPSYKLEYFIVDKDEHLERYHVPEEGYLIIVKKEHLWTKEPDFTYWRS